MQINITEIQKIILKKYCNFTESKKTGKIHSWPTVNQSTSELIKHSNDWSKGRLTKKQFYLAHLIYWIISTCKDSISVTVVPKFEDSTKTLTELSVDVSDVCSKVRLDWLADDESQLRLGILRPPYKCSLNEWQVELQLENWQLDGSK